MKHLEDLYIEACNRPHNINEHLPTLRRLASQCEAVIEFGVDIATSTTALLAAQPARLTSYDVKPSPQAEALRDVAGLTAFDFRVASSLDVEPEPCDLLFIDSLHTADQLLGELRRHAGQVCRWIVLHDVIAFAWTGENGQPGLVPALLQWWRECPGWRIAESYHHNNGLLVLERIQ